MWCTHTRTHTRTHTYTHVRTHTHTHTLEHYSLIKRNEIMPFAVMCVDLEITILSEVSQTKEDKYHIISHVEFKIRYK